VFRREARTHQNGLNSQGGVRRPKEDQGNEKKWLNLCEQSSRPWDRSEKISTAKKKGAKQQRNKIRILRWLAKFPQKKEKRKKDGKKLSYLKGKDVAYKTLGSVQKMTQ